MFFSWFLPIMLIFQAISATQNFEGIASPTYFTNNVQTFLENQNNSISDLCKSKLLQYVKDLRLGKLWALKMFDAAAKLPSGILTGNLVDLGSFDECLSIEENLETHAQIFGQYCIGTMPINISLPTLQKFSSKVAEQPKIATRDGKFGIQLAICMPEDCLATELQKVFEGIGFNMFFYEELCQTKATQPQLKTSGIITLYFFGFILLLIITSTIYDVFLYYSNKKLAHPLLIAFSLATNGKKLITVNSSARFACVDGIRTMVTIFIIYAHTHSIPLGFPMVNSFALSNWFQTKTNMYLLGATVCVDTFFLITGMLISYSYVRLVVVRGTKFSIVAYYINRYIRLTPVLAVMVLFHITLLEHQGSGPIWSTSLRPELIGACEKYWWKALLHIQNYGRQNFRCVPQSWYLSIDMQLVLISPLLLLPLKKWPKLTLAVTGFLTLCSIVYCFVVGWFFELNMNILGNKHPEKFKNFGDHYYFATPSRAAPWLIGIVLGYLVIKTEQRKEKLVINKIVLVPDVFHLFQVLYYFSKQVMVVLILWMCSLVVLSTCVFVGHDLIFGEYDKLRNSLHMALVRPSWAVAVGWMIFACIFGYGGPVNCFLSLPVFQILSKLTFTMYMVHYTLIFAMTAQMRIVPLFSDTIRMFEFWGQFAFSCVLAIIVTLAIELPTTAIVKALFEPKKS